jgi:SAM-dependent methyltransferase
MALATRVFGLEGWDDPYMAYEELGAQTRRAIVGLLPDDWIFEGKRVLDFGSGAGRTLRQFLPEAEEGEFWGADLDAASVDWLRATLCPPLHAWRASPGPPLGLEHGSFDLAWAVSVFTHLTDTSAHWLLELHHLLKPGGLLIATYMGRWNSEFAAGEPWDENRIGRNVLSHNRSWDAGGPAVLMSDWWVRAHWGRAFEILRIAPQIQNMSWALLRKREVELTTEDLESPASDPREYVALRHNLAQVQREIVQAELRSAVEQREMESALRSEYEKSLSWRITRSLRLGARVSRSLRARSRQATRGASRDT